MRWTDIGQEACSIARTLALVGDRWTLMLLRNAFLGTRRFAEFQRQLGAARNIVADRLEKLVEHGILERRTYQERPVRQEYVLTEKGRDLQPIMLALVRWGDTWTDDGAGPPVANIHTGCGQAMHLRGVCSECGEPLTMSNVRPQPGPGARFEELPPRLRETLASRDR